MTELTITTKQEITEQLVKDYCLGSGTKLNNQQFMMFLNIAKSFNLNPFKREIYAIPYERNTKVNGNWTKVQDMSILTGYQVYIERANETGLLDGWKTEIIYKDGKIKGAKITIWRKDWKSAFEREVSIKEFIKINKEGKVMGIRATMPEFMIKKVVIGQGFRLAFPSQLGGMPYLQEELGTEKEIIPEIKEEEKKETISKEDLEVAFGGEGKTLLEGEKIFKNGKTVGENLKDFQELGKEANEKISKKYKCKECGEVITKKVYEFKELGLCMKCQKNKLQEKMTNETEEDF